MAEVATDPVTLEVARFDAVAACERTGEQIEGPFYVDAGTVRRDLTEGLSGQPLRVGLRVRDLDAGCAPIVGAVVDVWQADAAGLYSAIPAAPQGRPDLDDAERSTTALRGAQVTDADGIAEFLTIHPGRYPGRTPHLHVKVHLDDRTVLTSQLYFDDAVNEEVLADERYVQQAGGAPPTTNADDGFFATDLVLATGSVADELVGVLTLDVARP